MHSSIFVDDSFLCWKENRKEGNCNRVSNRFASKIWWQSLHTYAYLWYKLCSRSPSTYLTYTHTHSFFLLHTHALTHALPHSHTHARTNIHTHFLSLTHTHGHTHTGTHTHTHKFTNAPSFSAVFLPASPPPSVELSRVSNLPVAKLFLIVHVLQNR